MFLKKIFRLKAINTNEMGQSVYSIFVSLGQSNERRRRGKEKKLI